jgi:diguanylate cyclase
MFRKKKPEEDKSSTNDKTASSEYSERVSRLLLVCIEGIQKIISEGDKLFSALSTLKEVIKKAVRPKPHSGIAKDLEDFFNRIVLEKKFRETKNDAIRQIVNGLTGTLKGMMDSSTEFDHQLGACIEQIESAEMEEDILKLKDEIICEIQKARENSSHLTQELEGYRKTTQSLAKKLEHTEAKALVDTLTNVLNRNAYNLKMAQLIREFEQFAEPFAVLVIDIDHFKKFNDKYGHRAGDRVLNSVANSLKGALRATDLIFRYGGEEFVVLLNKITIEHVGKLAEKLRSHIEKDYYVDQDRQLKVTVSVGCAVAKEGDTEETLFDRADQAMYEAKKKGRNRIEINN